MCLLDDTGSLTTISFPTAAYHEAIKHTRRKVLCLLHAWIHRCVRKWCCDWQGMKEYATPTADGCGIIRIWSLQDKVKPFLLCHLGAPVKALFWFICKHANLCGFFMQHFVIWTAGSCFLMWFHRSLVNQERCNSKYYGTVGHL